MPADEDTDNVYEVTVQANGETLDVEVTVTDVDEVGKQVSRRTLSRRQAGRWVLTWTIPTVKMTRSGNGPFLRMERADGRT